MNKMNPKLASEESKVPTDLSRALAAAPKAKALWSDLTPIARRDFISWIDSAKQLQTRKRRVEVACSKLEAGKRRPCCYAIIPMNLYRALAADPKAKAQWSDLSPNARRDFADWVESPKESATRKSRIEEACVMIAAGEQRP